MIIQADSLVRDPVVSVAIFCYNQENTLGQTLDSIISQDFSKPFEIVIGEDCSTDDTAMVCKEYQAKFPHLIKLLLHEKNVGSMGNFRLTIAEARGQFITFCAGDDYWNHPSKLSIQYKFLTENPGISLVHTPYQILHEKDGRISHSPRFDFDVTDANLLLSKGNFIGALTVMIKTMQVLEALKQGLFDMGFLMEDYPLWLYATESNKRMGFIDIETAVWRKNEESLSNSKNIKKTLLFELSILAIREYFTKRGTGFIQFKPILISAYKSMLYRAFIFKEDEIATQTLYKLKTLGGADWRQYLYGSRVFQKPFRFLRNLIKA